MYGSYSYVCGNTAPNVYIGIHILKERILRRIFRSNNFILAYQMVMLLWYMLYINKECDREYENGRWKYPDCEYRVIHRLCVHPKYQNRGVAKSTLFHIEEELKKMNIRAIRLDVFSNNPFALSLYFGIGYEKVGFADWRMGR